MKVLVDYSTHCSTTRSSFSFDLTSCSVSLGAFSWLSTRSCMVLMSQAMQRMTTFRNPEKINTRSCTQPGECPANSSNNSSDRKKQQMLPDIRRMSGDVFIFQQDSAPAHRAWDTIELLRHETPDFIGPDVWPANSPDLNPVDYRIWGLIQERVYQTAIRDTNYLKQCLTCVLAELMLSVVDKAIEQWRPRHSRKGTTLWTAAKLNIAFSCLTLRFPFFVQWLLLVAFRNIAYVTVVLVTFKFQQIVRSWYSVHVTFVCTDLWTIYLRSNLPNLFKIRRVLRKLWQNTFWCVF